MATKKATNTKKVAPAKKSTVKAASASTYESVREHVSSSLRSAKFLRALVAEFIGTFLLASVVIVGSGQPIFVLFGIVGIVLMIGAVSGAHINPAVTIGAWVTKRICWLRTLGYVLFQVLGAVVAFFTLKLFLGGAEQPTADALSYGASAKELFSAGPIADLEDNKQWYVFGAEVLATLILGYAVAHATRVKDGLTAAFSVGGGIFVALMVGITAAGYVGASSIINPAVAVALQAFADSSSWSYAAYALAPVVGGVIGFILYDLVSGNEK